MLEQTVPDTQIIAAMESELDRVIRAHARPDSLRDAVAYAALGGGKRLRPTLAWRCCEAVGGDGARSIPAGVAVELIHAFSLVHDDLPALDNDEIRRGRPTLHVHAGEAMAILAGDELLTLAFAGLSEASEIGETDRLSLVRELAAGTSAMITGQVLDTLGGFADDEPDLARLERTHANKTGALIRAACRMGAICGRADAARLQAITSYAESIGLMFQVIDDLIDATQSSEHAGKRTGKDAEAGKLTYPSLLGVEGTRDVARELLSNALDAADALGATGEPLRNLAERLEGRTR